MLDSVGSSFVNYHTAPLVALALLSSTSATNILLIVLDDEQTASTYPQTYCIPSASSLPLPSSSPSARPAQ